MRRMMMAGSLVVLSGWAAGQERAMANPDGSKVGEGAGWLVQEPSIAKTPNWVPGAGPKSYPIVHRNPGPYSRTS